MVHLFKGRYTSSLGEYLTRDDCEFVPAIGEPSVRENVYEKGLSLGLKAAKLVDQTAIVSSTAKICHGCVVKQYVEVSSYVEVGEGTLLQPASFLGHDIKVGKCCVISTGAAIGGATHIGSRTYIGLNVSLRQGLTIGHDAIIAMGSVVYKDVADGLTVIGNPARVTKGNDQHRALV